MEKKTFLSLAATDHRKVPEDMRGKEGREYSSWKWSRISLVRVKEGGVRRGMGCMGERFGGKERSEGE